MRKIRESKIQASFDSSALLANCKNPPVTVQLQNIMPYSMLHICKQSCTLQRSNLQTISIYLDLTVEGASLLARFH